MKTASRAIAGATAKTAIAPLDRIKILFQTHQKDYVQYSGTFRGAALALVHVFRTQGVLGLFRGHSLTLARAVPHTAIGYAVYDRVRDYFMPAPEHHTTPRRIIAGAMAGISVLPFTYPFELVRVRLAIQTRTGHDRPHILAAFRSIYASPPESTALARIGHFYRGFGVTALGTVPYRGGIFLVWESLNAWARHALPPAFHEANINKIHLLIGALAGASAQIATYPLEVIRRTQQASGGAYMSARMGVRETVRTVWASSGWRGFYVGLGIGLVKQVPQHAISLAVWQASKKALGI